MKRHIQSTLSSWFVPAPAKHCLGVIRLHPIWATYKSSEQVGDPEVNRNGPLKNKVYILIHAPLSKLTALHKEKCVLKKKNKMSRRRGSDRNHMAHKD